MEIAVSKDHGNPIFDLEEKLIMSSTVIEIKGEKTPPLKTM